MAQSVVLKGSEIKIYVNGKIYPEARSLTYIIDYGETEIYGIDSQFPQEIAATRISIQGSISGVKVKATGGLQAYGLRPKTKDLLSAPYVTIRIKDRQSDEDILWLPQAKVTSENFRATAKGLAELSFKFKGIVPFSPIDMS